MSYLIQLILKQIHLGYVSTVPRYNIVTLKFAKIEIPPIIDDRDQILAVHSSIVPHVLQFEDEGKS